MRLSGRCLRATAVLAMVTLASWRTVAAQEFAGRE
jgi:hypothetical protein